ncbi:MAG TPA: O-antigen ligase family protein [Stellaceae bacterium]|nr:O-antigen ligase family protein [Stellaceae bacterium]
MQQSLRARAAGAILPVTALILPPLAVFAPLGDAPLLAVAALAIIVLDGPRCLASLDALKSLAVLLAALGLWGAASAAWSILPGHSLFEGGRFLLESAGGLVFLARALAASDEERRRLARALSLGIVLAVLLLALERFANAPVTRWWLGIPATEGLNLSRFDRGVTVLVLVLWPMLCAATPVWWRGILLLAVVGMAALMASATALLAALASLAAFVIARLAPRATAGAIIAGLLGISIAIPLAVPGYDTTVALHEQAPWIKWSGIHRLLIWRFAADRVAERPILGWGMDASREIPGGKVEFNDVLPALHYPGGAQRLPLHPHDAVLQLQLELGVPGLALGLAVILWPIWRIGWPARFSPGRRAGALALGVATLIVGLLSFGVWQAWWLSTVWLAAGLFAATKGRETIRPDHSV